MASAWGSSWGSAWGNSWGTISAATAVTIAGKVRSAPTEPAPRISRATQYFRKTLTELREEEKARLKKLEAKARRKVAKAVEAGTSEPGPLSEAARTAFERTRKGRTSPPAFLPTPFLNELIAMIVAEATAGILASYAAEEDDIEVLLLASV